MNEVIIIVAIAIIAAIVSFFLFGWLAKRSNANLVEKALQDAKNIIADAVQAMDDADLPPGFGE